MFQISNDKLCQESLVIFFKALFRIHIIGYMHEQSRSDRDRYVRINSENIENNAKGNFQKCRRCNNQRLPYDTESVMHYGSYAFSKNGKPTITVKDGSSIGQRNGFSSLDLEGINQMYCSNK